MTQNYRVLQTVQEKITENYRFFQRAKILQKKHGFITDEELSGVIGISPKTFYNAIKDSPITEKTWGKLESAERTAGILPPEPAPPPPPVQPLEKRASDFPDIGKSGGAFSNDWKISRRDFQRLESKVDELIALLKGQKGGREL